MRKSSELECFEIEETLEQMDQDIFDLQASIEDLEESDKTFGYYKFEVNYENK